jgi:hypothetical protein
MKALRGISILMVFLVAATLFAYLAFVHPIGTQFVHEKLTQAVADARKIVKEQVGPTQVKPEKALEDAPPPATPLVSKASVPMSAPPQNAGSEKDGSKASRPVPASKGPRVAKNKPQRGMIDNPFKLERSEFSRADIDAIIERRRRIKDKLGDL